MNVQALLSEETKPVETAEQLSSIAFSFMASKALFAGLHIELFSVLADGPKTIEQLSEATRVPINRVGMLTTALVSIGLLSYADDKRLQNSPAAESFLSRQSKYDFGDYLRYQIDQQMYPCLLYTSDAADD